MDYVHCEVSDGPRPGFKTIGIESIEGFKEYLAIEQRFLKFNGQDWYLPIIIVGKDSDHNTALIELPLEADSGAKRVWVHNDDVTANPEKILA
jgi:hypothetical protein